MWFSQHVKNGFDPLHSTSWFSAALILQIHSRAVNLRALCPIALIRPAPPPLTASLPSSHGSVFPAGFLLCHRSAWISTDALVVRGNAGTMLPEHPGKHANGPFLFQCSQSHFPFLHLAVDQTPHLVMITSN